MVTHSLSKGKKNGTGATPQNNIDGNLPSKVGKLGENGKYPSKGGKQI